MERTLADIIKDIPGLKQIIGPDDIPIKGIHFDSRKILPGYLFIAVKGTQTDGHVYINMALDRGATAIVCEQLPQELSPGITYVVFQNTHLALAGISSNYYNRPSQELTLIAVTGTNGKTTIATSLYNFFEKAGYKAGLISTIKYLMHNYEWPATHTTPDPMLLNQLMRKMIDEHQCSHAFMEVSSHALVQERVAFLDYDGAIFTNITHDHLDYHGSFRNYLYAKKKLFDNLKPGSFALVNSDDKNHKVIIQNTKAQVYTYGLKSMADFKARILEKHFDGTLALIDGHEIWLNLIGQFNVSNLLAVYATAVILGTEKHKALEILSSLKPVDGRFQIIKKDDITAIVDYAHTPDALENILAELNSIRQPGQRIITVVGAGGNRDHEKRPKMGKIASLLSDVVIITSDNPRYEKPEDIIKQIEQGADRNQAVIIKITDRREAIISALNIARKGDIVLVAGKGHETYQEINGVKYHFDDREIIKETFGL